MPNGKKVTLAEAMSSGNGSGTGAIIDPLTSSLFSFSIPRVPAGDGQFSADLRLRCQQVSLPARTINPVQVTLHAHEYQFAGKMAFSHDLSVTFVERRDMKVFETLSNWMNYCKYYTNQGGSYKSDYAVTAYLHTFDQKLQEQQEYEFKYLWPNTIGDIQFDADENLVTLSATFQYDYWKARYDRGPS